VIVELPLLLIVPVDALNVAEVADAATVTEAGTVSTALELESPTLAPPVGAGWVNVTVQVLDEFCPKLLGLQANEETSTGATRLMLAEAEVLL